MHQITLWVSHEVGSVFNDIDTPSYSDQMALTDVQTCAVLIDKEYNYALH